MALVRHSKLDSKTFTNSKYLKSVNGFRFQWQSYRKTAKIHLSIKAILY